MSKQVIAQTQYAILLDKYIFNPKHGDPVLHTTWYWSAGKYSNSFSTSSSLDGARMFPTFEKASELLNSEKFQKRLSLANDTHKRINIRLYYPEIIATSAWNLDELRNNIKGLDWPVEWR